MIKSKQEDYLTTRVSLKMKEEIEQIATEHRATISEVVRYAVQKLIDEEEV
tara:strand:- start:125 stop:277 length:153 start_codon:yes stop_codon:yes gene_type:complete